MIANLFIVSALIFGTVSHAPVVTVAFPVAAPVGVLRRNTATTTTELAAWDTGGKRREIFGWIKKAAVAGLAFNTASSPNAVVAEDAAGRVVTFNVNNLNGEEGKTGTFKIQVINEWAPRGAARFEVRSESMSDGFSAMGDDDKEIWRQPREKIGTEPQIYD